MPYEVTLTLEQPASDGQTFSVTVQRVTLSENQPRLEGLDPAHYPQEIRPHIDFYSQHLTGIIKSDSPLSVDTISPTQKPIPQAVPDH